jgi:Ca-activated chloride channel family protein
MYRDVPVDIDEPTLQAIADRTGGKYYRADSPDTLKKIFSEIDQLEKTEVEVKKFVRRYELFHWFVLPGLGLLLLELLLGNTVWRKLP